MNSKFEKPQICGVEFISCNIPVLSTKVPTAVTTAILCQISAVIASLPTAVVY